MVEISLSGSGEGSGLVTAPGYSTAAFSEDVCVSVHDERSHAAPSAPNRAGWIERYGADHFQTKRMTVCTILQKIG
jgi:hypothetical protein